MNLCAILLTSWICWNLVNGNSRNYEGLSSRINGLKCSNIITVWSTDFNGVKSNHLCVDTAQSNWSQRGTEAGSDQRWVRAGWLQCWDWHLDPLQASECCWTLWGVLLQQETLGLLKSCILEMLYGAHTLTQTRAHTGLRAVLDLIFSSTNNSLPRQKDISRIMIRFMQKNKVNLFAYCICCR